MLKIVLFFAIILISFSLIADDNSYYLKNPDKSYFETIPFNKTLKKDVLQYSLSAGIYSKDKSQKGISSNEVSLLYGISNNIQIGISSGFNYVRDTKIFEESFIEASPFFSEISYGFDSVNISIFFENSFSETKKGNQMSGGRLNGSLFDSPIFYMIGIKYFPMSLVENKRIFYGVGYQYKVKPKLSLATEYYKDQEYNGENVLIHSSYIFKNGSLLRVGSGKNIKEKDSYLFFMSLVGDLDSFFYKKIKRSPNSISQDTIDKKMESSVSLNELLIKKNENEKEPNMTKNIPQQNIVKELSAETKDKNQSTKERINRIEMNIKDSVDSMKYFTSLYKTRKISEASLKREYSWAIKLINKRRNLLNKIRTEFINEFGELEWNKLKVSNFNELSDQEKIAIEFLKNNNALKVSNVKNISVKEIIEEQKKAWNDGRTLQEIKKENEDKEKNKPVVIDLRDVKIPESSVDKDKIKEKIDAIFKSNKKKDSEINKNIIDTHISRMKKDVENMNMEQKNQKQIDEKNEKTYTPPEDIDQLSTNLSEKKVNIVQTASETIESKEKINQPEKELNEESIQPMTDITTTDNISVVKDNKGITDVLNEINLKLKELRELKKDIELKKLENSNVGKVESIEDKKVETSVEKIEGISNKTDVKVDNSTTEIKDENKKDLKKVEPKEIEKFSLEKTNIIKIKNFDLKEEGDIEKANGPSF